MTDLAVLCPAVFAVALVYSSVGHGGASGYLAVMALAGMGPTIMSSGALLLNLVVAGLAFAAFRSAGQKPGSLVIPFLIGSVPTAIIGAWLRVPLGVYNWLLAIVLLAAAIRMFGMAGATGARTALPPSVPNRILIGAVIGLISGIVGVGGGILLSPLLLWRKWAGVRMTAAASAVFIVINSVAGIGGRAMAGTFEPLLALPVFLAAAAGGWLGGMSGATKLPVPTLRRVLAGVLLIAAVGKVIR